MSLTSIRKKVIQSARAFGKSNAAIFDNIYAVHGWGGDDDLCSGAGSTPANSTEYENLIVDYITANGIKSIVDLGCGDFQVSGRILARLPDEVRYTGLDVSQLIVKRNTERFANERISFQQCDATKDSLPPADLVLVREVLQHLSNQDILAILPKLAAFAHIIVTNTRTHGAQPPNGNQASGASSREVTCGGLWLDEPPFNCATEKLLSVAHMHRPSDIITERLTVVS